MIDKQISIEADKKAWCRDWFLLSFLQKPELAKLPKNKVSIQIFAIHDGNGAYGWWFWKGSQVGTYPSESEM